MRFSEPKDRIYLWAVIAHIVLGGLVFVLPILSKVYAVSIFAVGFIYILRTQNRNHEILLVCGYLVGAEIVLRMTDGNLLYEYAKYCIIFFMLMGMYYRGFSKEALPYWIFLVLLLPGMVISTQVLVFTESLRKSIAFNISGPICLGISSLYLYRRPITFGSVNKILLYTCLPIVTATTYLIFYTPNIQEVITGTSSNFETSGGFGPNQVSTILGLGMFIAFTRMVLFSPTLLLLALNSFLFLAFAYRGLVTFSRGGIITAGVVIAIFVAMIYRKVVPRAKGRFNAMIALCVGFSIVVWLYSSLSTGGMIEKRYANQDAAGRVKASRFSGREQILESEIDLFLKNPIFGVGVARGKEIRLEQSKKIIASHNEITRMLSEHGAMGILALVIVFFTPIFLYLDNRANIYAFCFIAFWLLTINHAAMRLAAPAFIYALSVIKIIKDDDETDLHRQLPHTPRR